MGSQRSGDRRAPDHGRGREEGVPAVRAVGGSGACALRPRVAARVSPARAAAAAASAPLARLVRDPDDVALYGFRPDGLAFNERYLLEILPLAAIAFAWALEDCGLRPVALGIGAALAGIVVVTLVLMMPVGGVHGRLLELCLRVFLKGPLALAGALALVWLLDWAGVRRRMLLSGLVGACLGWELTVHLSGDVLASQSVRATSLKRTEALASVLTDRSALVTYAANKQAVPAGPLLFNRDIVIVQTEVDDGKDAPVLIRELLASGRRVFVLEDGFSAERTSTSSPVCA